MSMNNILFCCCRQLKSVIKEKSLVKSRHLSLYTFKYRDYSNQDSSKRLCSRKNVQHSIQRYITRQSTSSSTDLEQGTVSGVELDKFKKIYAEWWKPDGQYAALRSLNKLRVPLIRDLLVAGQSNIHPSKPLCNFKILDVGCGGGILAEPLARLGATVTAIDPLSENIEAARAHAVNDNELGTLTYECTTIEEMNATSTEQFDLVVASEVLEHVENPSIFISHCCDSLKHGGHLVVTTINRSVLSTLLVKYAAEYLLRIVPENTHDETKFITPDELTDMLRDNDMTRINFRGMILNPLTNYWSWTESLSMNYACHAKKM